MQRVCINSWIKAMITYSNSSRKEISFKHQHAWSQISGCKVEDLKGQQLSSVQYGPKVGWGKLAVNLAQGQGGFRICLPGFVLWTMYYYDYWTTGLWREHNMQSLPVSSFKFNCKQEKIRDGSSFSQEYIQNAKGRGKL